MSWARRERHKLCLFIHYPSSPPLLPPRKHSFDFSDQRASETTWAFAIVSAQAKPQMRDTGGWWVDGGGGCIFFFQNK